MDIFYILISGWFYGYLLLHFLSHVFYNRTFYFNAVTFIHLLYDLLFMSCLRKPALPCPAENNVNHTISMSC